MWLLAMVILMINYLLAKHPFQKIEYSVVIRWL